MLNLLNSNLLALCLIASCSLSRPALAAWEATGGPAGGYVRSIIAGRQCVYAATGGGGILASEDAGGSWSFRNAGLFSHDLKSLATLGDTLFVASDENVFRSADRGHSWEPCGTELAGKYIKTLVSHDGLLFAGTYLYGVFRSSDRGESWQAASDGLPDRYIYWLAADGDYLYAGTYLDGLFRSHDLGETWSAVNEGLGELNVMAMISFADR